MKLTFSKPEQRVILAVGSLALVIGWLYAAYLVLPLQREARRLAQEVQSARQRVGTLEAAVANEQVVGLEIFKIETIFPQRSPGDRKPAEGSSGKSAPTQPGPGAYEEALIQVEALAGYHQLGAFLGAVESGDKPVRVSSLHMVGNPKEPKRHHIKLLLRAYFATSRLADSGAM
ncbi:MAG: hypothetical protein HYW10_01195 [Candidatus Omnitrophica bacterium]|nr:hypothetical protein [Candidatus Omnitrophota bacterium]